MFFSWHSSFPESLPFNSHFFDDEVILDFLHALHILDDLTCLLLLVRRVDEPAELDRPSEGVNVDTVELVFLIIPQGTLNSARQSLVIDVFPSTTFVTISGASGQTGDDHWEA